MPYDIALRPGAAYKGEEITADLKTIIAEFQPTKIFVSHPADHHPDHRALYLFLMVALWELGGSSEPEIYPYLIHYPNWPQPSAYAPGAEMLPPPPLVDNVNWLQFPLTERQVERKLAALQAHETQWGSGARFLRRFVRQSELFGNFAVVSPLAIFPAELDSEDVAEAALVPEQLTEDEEELFVTVEPDTVRVSGEQIILSLELSRALPLETSASLYLFGWREDVAFGDMPKLHLRFARRTYDVFDQRSRLAGDNVAVERNGNQIRAEVPLALLGQPERLFVSVRSQTETVPLDWAPWRIIDLSRTQFLSLPD